MTWVRDARLAAGPEISSCLEAIFRPGTCLVTTFEPLTVGEVTEVAMLRVPSGRLVVDCPWSEEGRELAVRIPPGAYRLESAWTECQYEFMGELVVQKDSSAARLCVSDGPVAVWEMALGLGDDVERLQEGEQVGFATDTSMGCFADATAWSSLTTPFRKGWEDHEAGRPAARATEVLCGGHFERTTDDAQAADLITVSAVEGLSVVWLGRTESGDVASVVLVGGPAAELARRRP